MRAEIERLEKRIREIEDIEAIKSVQYSYWRYVDLQQPDQLREVFYPGEIYIEFEDMPVWRDRESFVVFYRDLGCHPTRRENHFGVAPCITVTGEDSAKGSWRLQMTAYNYESRTTIQVTGEYDGEYIRADGRWWIRSLLFRRHSLYAQQIATNGGVYAPDFGGTSTAANAHLFGTQDGSKTS
jgi:SnoaL-like domain